MVAAWAGLVGGSGLTVQDAAVGVEEVGFLGCLGYTGCLRIRIWGGRCCGEKRGGFIGVGQACRHLRFWLGCWL